MSPLYQGGQRIEPRGLERLYRGNTLLYQRTPSGPDTTTDFGPALAWSSTPYFEPGKFGNAWDKSGARNTGVLPSPTGGPISWTGDFTLECWMYVTGTLDTRTRIGVGGGTNNNNFVNLGVLRATAGAKPSIQIGSLVYNYGADAYPFDQWVHIAGEIDSITTPGTRRGRFYMNGKQLTTVNGIGTILDWPAGMQIGAPIAFNSNNRFIGLLDEVRLSKVARYRGAFTPSTEPFAVDADTMLLYHLNAA